MIESKIDITGRKIVPHSLRFTYVTRMRRNSSAEDVQKIVGHTTVEMTEYYTRILEDEMADSVMKFIPTSNKLFL